MIRETHIDRDVNRLLTHFQARAVGRPPATAANLAALEALVGPLPRDLMLFLATTDGLRVELMEPRPFAHLWSSHEMLQSAMLPGLPSMPLGFLPIAGGESQRDWIVLLPGSCHGVVIRCDPWAGENSLVASCFGSYLEHWTNHLIELFDTHGRPKSGAAPHPFDANYVSAHDVKFWAIRENTDVQMLLGELQMTCAAGADFE